MIGAIIVAALATSKPMSCSAPNASDKIVERKILSLRDGGQLQAVSTSRHGDGPMGFVSSQVTVFSTDCEIVFQQRFDDTVETRFDQGSLESQPILILTSFEPAGSACGYEHTILTYQGGFRGQAQDVRILSPGSLAHNNMDGFYAGDLGGRRGFGLVLWQSLQDGPYHYSASRYRVTIYGWANDPIWRNAGHFTGPTVRTTSKKYEPSPDDVAKSLGFSFRDMTDQARFGGC